MNKKIVILICVILVLIGGTIIFLNLYKSDITCKNLNELPSERAKEFSLTILDKNQNPVVNKKIKIEQLRQDILINNREEFTNYEWIEAEKENLRGFESKRTLTSEEIINELGLISDKPKKTDEGYILLNIPLSFPENVKISDYEEVETHVLEEYAKAFNQAEVVPDFVQLLAELNLKMQFVMDLNSDEAIDFADRYIRRANELFPDSKLILDLEPFYCYENFGNYSAF